MPDSFGRVESHCFGCEGVFNGQLAEKIAERVFVKLVAEQPQNPRVHYLLGYLRESESRPQEALHSFREAVRLDPDYLNAWQKLLRLKDTEPGLTAEERDEAAFEMFRLDPQGRHVHTSVMSVQDLSRLWTVLKENEERIAKPKKEFLFALKAAKKRLAEKKTDTDRGGIHFQHSDQHTDFAFHGELTRIVDLIDSSL